MLSLWAVPALAAGPQWNRLSHPVTGIGARRAAEPGGYAVTWPDGRVLVSVRLATNPVGAVPGLVEAEQAQFLQRALGEPGVEVVARTRHVLNAVFLAVPAEALPSLSADGSVVRVTPVANYEVDLSETVPYIGASAVQAAGKDGSGVKVAVFDSGIDYLHVAFGGSGDPADFAANNPDVIEPGTFPTARVVGGFDFVGSQWPDGPLLPDPDPIDDGPARGHGTHVADIIGGADGVAPGVDLYAVKVCSSVGPSCSGVALIQGMDFAADPNGDGDTSDRVDIINMSLGSNYGQPFDDDLALAVDNATALGILTVASAGNGGDRPYVTGTPAAATTALSVAQTTVPSALQDQFEVTAPASAVGTYLAVAQPWAPVLAAEITGVVQYGDGAGGNTLGCAPFSPGSLAGQIVLVDRGACAFSDKIRNIEDAGGILGIIGLVAPGAPFGGAFGGGAPITIPAFMIDQASANLIRSGATVRFDPALGIPLAGTIVSSSSRGPRNGDSGLKPEIGAPGASVSAVAGSGIDTGPFGGTSGAAPMVAGSAALLLQANPWFGPMKTKTFLMNYANASVSEDFRGLQAPASRIGAGEVDVRAAVEGGLLVWNEVEDGTLSFGYQPVSRSRETFVRRLTIWNRSDDRRQVRVSNVFQGPSDATGAVQPNFPSRITLAPKQVRTFVVRFVVNGELLPTNSMTSGSGGNDPATLNATEFDGWLVFEDGIDTVSVPWHIIPRKSADVRANTKVRFRSGEARVALNNRGVGPANNDAFTLLAVSDKLPPPVVGTEAPTPDLRAVGLRTIAVPAGFCSADPSFLVQLAFSSWRPQSHLLPVIFFAELDTDGDGDTDYEILNGDFFLLNQTLDGRNLSLVFDVAAGTTGAFFFAEHATNTTNTVVTVCAEQIGMTAADLGTRSVTLSFGASDFYFGGPGDAIPAVTFTLGAERYTADVDDLGPFERGTMTVTDNGGTGPELGIMLITNGDRGPGNRGGATPASETLLFAPRGTVLFP